MTRLDGSLTPAQSNPAAAPLPSSISARTTKSVLTANVPVSRGRENRPLIRPNALDDRIKPSAQSKEAAGELVASRRCGLNSPKRRAADLHYRCWLTYSRH
jgi:hypothetical protein